MKKFLKITALIVLLLFIFFVGAFKYRQYKANQTQIPINTTSLAKINVDEIYKSLVLNMFSNPSFYLKSDLKKNKEPKIDKFDFGLKIPASIYLYTIKNQPKTAFFSRFEIKKLYFFEHFLLSTLHMEIIKNDKNGVYSKSGTGNIAIYYNRKYAAIVISKEAANFEPVLKDILNQKDFGKIDENKFSDLEKSTDHIAFANKEHLVSLNFDTGVINLSDEFISQNIVPISEPHHRKFNNESAISFWLNANFKTPAKQNLQLKKISLEQDSLAKYYNGYLDFEWINTTQQIDSIITYDYNDDFEKVEKVTLQKRDIPNFVINVSANATSLKNYLNGKNIINLDSGMVNKSVFPIYRVLVGGNEKQLLLSTSKGNKVGLNTESTSNFFTLNVDFLKLNRQINQPLFARYFKDLTFLKVTGRKQENDRIRIDGKLELANKDINSLYQLLKIF